MLIARVLATSGPPLWLMNFIAGLHHFLRWLGTAIESSEREEDSTSVTTSATRPMSNGGSVPVEKSNLSLRRARAPRARLRDYLLDTMRVVRSAFLRAQSAIAADLHLGYGVPCNLSEIQRFVDRFDENEESRRGRFEKGP